MGKRRYNIDEDVARQRGIAGGKSRTVPDYYISKLAEAAATLTAEQVRRLGEVLDIAGAAQSS